MGSSRLPGKTLKRINGKSLVQIMLSRVSKCQSVDKIIVATSTNDNNNELEEHIKELGHYCFRGSESDVLDRFYKSLENDKCDYVVRLTADCPLIDPELIDKTIISTIKSNKDYGSNISPEKEFFPDGQDIEVFRYKILKDAWTNATLPSEREHVTPYIRTNLEKKYTNYIFLNDIDYNKIRMTVDTQEDFDAIEVLINELGTNRTWLEYTDFIIKNPNKFKNQNLVRNEGYKKSLEEDKHFNK